MKIKSLSLKNFKRFTDLTLQDIPDNAKLVLLIGSNGSGKSSVFDGLQVISDLVHRTQIAGSRSFTFSGGKEYLYYHKKPGLLEIDLNFTDGGDINCVFAGINNGKVTANKDFKINLFYGRSAVRYLPRITRTTIGQAIDINQDSDRPEYFIDEDKRFENDIDLLIKEVVEKIFAGINTDSNRQLEEVKLFLDKINEAFPRIFGTENGTKLSFRRFIPPAEGNPSRLMFDKGISQINYDLLSAGEKEVVNLLFNLFVRNRYFNDTIYFLDEIDTHLNTKLQYALIQEIVENWIPDNCQLWTASHSLGFIDYANDYEYGCVIDFDDLDFDKPQILIPKPKDDFEIFELAVSKTFIDKVVQGRKIIFAENTDTPLYNDLALENVLFFIANDKMDVFHKAKNHHHHGLIDRDYLADEEIADLKTDYPYIYILPYYSIENLLFHPDNLEEYCSTAGLNFNKEDYKQALTKIKNEEKDYLLTGIIQARSGYPFYKENEHTKKLKTFRENHKAIVDLIRSNEFEEFYKVFPAKDYGRKLIEQINFSRNSLAKTNWFKSQIEKLIK